MTPQSPLPHPVHGPTLAEVERLPAHPRLFTREEGWRQLPARIRSDPVLARVHRNLRQRADEILQLPLIEHQIDGIRRLDYARALQERIFVLATLARLESDARCVERVHREIERLLDLPDWGTRHFLDVAEYALAAAVALDWLHETWAPPLRQALVRGLVDKALRPSFEADAHALRWLGGRSNWTQVCHAGLAAAALAVAGHEPALAARTLARAVTDQAGPLEAYTPDGAYPEGPTYWAYGTSFHVILASLLENAFGSDYGLAAYPGLMESADYIRHMIAPSGAYFDYADSRETVPPLALLHWFAEKAGRPELAGPELLRLESGTLCGPGEPLVAYQRLDALAFWWRRRPHFALSETPDSPFWIGQGETPVAAFRTSWADARAGFLGIKGGSPASSHAHMDVGTFVYEWNGIRWAVDPGMQDYHSLEQAGLALWDSSQDADRWRIFRLGPSAHNILRFNGAAQDVGGAAPLLGGPDGAALDLTPLYRQSVSSVFRQASLQPDGSLRIEDRWATGAAAVEAASQWLTYATVEPDPEGAVLIQQGQRLRLRVDCPTPWTLRVEDPAQEMQPYDHPLPGLRRLVFVSRTPAESQGRLTLIACGDTV